MEDSPPQPLKASSPMTQAWRTSAFTPHGPSLPSRVIARALDSPQMPVPGPGPQPARATRPWHGTGGWHRHHQASPEWNQKQGVQDWELQGYCLHVVHLQALPEAWHSTTPGQYLLTQTECGAFPSLASCLRQPSGHFLPRPDFADIGKLAQPGSA